MSCIRCGNPKTIKAHLIPQVFCKEVIVGKALATSVTQNGSFFPSQSGTFDKNILCAKCDGDLGVNEKYAAITLRLIRQKSIGIYNGPTYLEELGKEKIIRFAAGILWKYSITQGDYGQINLYDFQEKVRQMAYGEIKIPVWFDVMMLRLKTHPLDTGISAYRAPFPDKINRVRIYRFMVGGVLFFCEGSQKKMRNDPTHQFWLSQKNELQYVIAPANIFEEYTLSKNIAFDSTRLSSFLDKQDMVAKNKRHSS